MKVLVTGASGYIGAAVVEKLLAAGHTAAGLARSDEAARKVESLGAAVRRGSLEDAASLASAAREADAVIHTAMAWGAQTAALDRGAVEAVIATLAGSDRPFLYTSGCWVMGNTGGRLAGEMFPLHPAELVRWRPAVERLVLDATEQRVRGVVIRPVIVYGRRGGLLASMIQGQLPAVGDGENHWTFVHIDDLAELYLLAVERAAAGQLYLGAWGAPQRVKDIAAAAGIPSFVPLEEARQKLGPFADALALDQKIGSTKAARELGWRPSRPGVVEELRRGYLA